MPKTIVPTGTTAVFGTSSFAINIDEISWEGATREAINTSHMGTTTAHTFVPADLVDQGTITLSGHYDPDEDPPQNGAAETVTISWPLESGETNKATLAASVFLISFSASAPKEDKATCTATFKITGDVTITAAS